MAASFPPAAGHGPRPVVSARQAASGASRPWLQVEPPPGLNDVEASAVNTVRRVGIVGALFLAIGSLGAGAAPVINPVFEIPVLRVFARMPAVSLAIAFAGMALLVAAWLLLGRYVRPGSARMASPQQVNRTTMLWVLPLLTIPPLFSRDVYSYLAQSEIAYLGMDPYELGPQQALSRDNPLTDNVSNIWKTTPAPYGPLFLQVGSWISRLAGNHIVGGVLLHRAVAVIGLILIVWALPRLARRFGVDPATALWLGAANPLVLFHLIAGVHNEALGIGLMMAGLCLGLSRLPIRVTGDTAPPLARGELTFIVLGATVMTLAATVKINAALALGFFGVMIARRWHGRIIDLLRAATGLIVVFLTVLVAVCLGTGLGFGWIGALGTPGMMQTLIAPMNILARAATGLGLALGMGNLNESLIGIYATLGLLIAAVITVKLLWSSFRWRLRPIIGLGVAMGVVMGLHVAVHPWWMLWAIIPLAAAAGTSRFRVAATIGSALLAIAVPPTGSSFEGRGFVLMQGYLAAGVVVIIALLIVRRTVPIWPTPNAKT